MSDTGDCGKVEDGVAALHCPIHGVTITNRTFDELEFSGRARKVLFAARREIVQDSYFGALYEQRLDDVAPDEPRSAGDERAHGEDYGRSR